MYTIQARRVWETIVYGRRRPSNEFLEGNALYVPFLSIQFNSISLLDIEVAAVRQLLGRGPLGD